MTIDFEPDAETATATIDFEPDEAAISFEPETPAIQAITPTSNVAVNMGREVLGGAAGGVADIAGGAAGLVAAPGRETQRNISEREKKLAELEAIPSVFDKFSQAEIEKMPSAPPGFRTPAQEVEIASLRDTVGQLKRVAAKDQGLQTAAEDFQKLASEAAKESQTFFGQDAARQDEFLSKFARGAGSLPPYIATGIAGGPVGSMLVGSLQTGQSEYNAAIQAGRPDLASAAMEKGLMIGLTEGAGVGGGPGAAASGFVKKAFATLKKGFEEGGQEWIQQVLQNLNASTATGYKPEQPTFAGGLESFTIGALLGGGVEGVSQVVERTKDAGLPATAAAIAETPPITAETPTAPAPAPESTATVPLTPSSPATTSPPTDEEITAAITETFSEPSAETQGAPGPAELTAETTLAPARETNAEPSVPIDTPVQPSVAVEEPAGPAIDPNLPTLRAGETQGDLLSKQTEDLALVGEKGVDFAKREQERLAAEKEAAEVKAIQDKAQRDLFDEELAKYHAEVRAELEEGMEAKHYELLDSLISLGGLPSLSTAKGQEASGEIGRVMESVSHLSPKSVKAKLTRKDALDLETLRENLNARGFNFETPYDMLTAIENRLASGKKAFGTKIPDDRFAFSYAPKQSSAVRWERGPNHAGNIARVVENLKRSVEGVRVRVLRNEADLPADVRAGLDPNGRYEGLVDTRNGDVWLFSDRIKNGERAAEVFAHEVIGHFGVEKIVDPKEWARIADSVIKRGGPQLGFVLNRNFPEKAVEDLTSAERSYLAREYVATLAENPSSNPSLWQRVLTVVRRGLRKLGIVRQWSEADIRNLITRGARAVQDTGGSRVVGGGFQTSKAADQTKTPEFKRWFGGSKVVDADGKPLVVHHGTQSEFDEFKPRYGLLNYFYFATNPRYAKAMSRREGDDYSTGAPRTIKAYLSIQRPFDLRSTSNLAEALSKIRETLGSDTPPKIKSQFPLQRMHEWQQSWAAFAYDVGQKSEKEFFNPLREALLKHGYDGIVFKEIGPTLEKTGRHQTDTWVAFRPEQIKSATDNSGAFDPNSRSIFGSRLPTSTKNAVTDEERRLRSAPEILAEARQTNQATLEQAQADLAANPQRGQEIVARLLSGERVRNISVDEEAILLVEKVRLMNERDAQGERSIDQSLAPEERAVAHTEWTALEAAINEMDQATHASGAEWGRMGQFRQRLIAADFTPEAMEGRARKAKGEPLNREEVAKIKAQAVEIARLEGDIAKLRAAIDAQKRAEAFEAAQKELEAEAAAEVEETAETEPHVAGLSERIRIALNAEADKALARIRKRRSEGRLSALPVNELADYAIYGAAKIAAGLVRKAQWAATMVKDLGNDVGPFLDEIWDASNAKLDAVVEKVARGDSRKTKRAVRKQDPQAGVDRVTDGMKKRLEEGDTMGQLAGLIRSLAKQFVKAGIRERNALLDAVHEVVSELDPTFTRRQTMDAISGYGDFKALDKSEVATTLRDLKGQMQQVAKIEDMQAKIPPAKTGVERRTPSDEERRLIKEVNELKKKGGFLVTDPAKQLKSAMDAIKTRLRNELSDLDHAIATKKPIAGKRGAPAYDAESNALKAQRDAKKAQYDALFPKAPLTPAEQLAKTGKALDRSIADLQADLKAGKLYADPAAPKLTSPQIEAKKARLEALRVEREMLRDLDTARVEAEKEASLREQVATLKERITKGETDVAAGTPTVDRAEIAALKEERKILQKQIADIRRGSKKTKDQIALQTYKARTATRIAELSDRIARGDFAPRPAPTPVAKDAEAQKLAFELNEKKKEFTRGVFEWQLANRSLSQQTLDLTRDVLNTARAVMTSFDLSAVLRQGGFIALGNPLRAVKAFPAMFKALMSAEGEFDVNTKILKRPNAPLYFSSGLYLHDPNDPQLSKMEEAYMSRWANAPLRIMGVDINPVAASQRAYTTFLNKLRADSFDAMSAGLAKSGSVTPDEAKVLASYINVATGRGDLGKKGNQAAVALNTVFFSPRYVASRFQLLFEPLRGLKFGEGAAARTRKAIAVEYAKFLGGAAVVYALGIAAGADLEWEEPKNPDFLKLRFGDTRIDFLSGLAQVTRFELQAADNLLEVLKGDGLDRNAGNFIGKFFRSKLSPQVGTTYNLITGYDFKGDEVEPAQEALKLVTPLTFGDLAAMMEEQGIPRGSVLSILVLLGASAQTY